eukprot:6194473-Pleurochrysis_carterae.AAC.3
MQIDALFDTSDVDGVGSVAYDSLLRDAKERAKTTDADGMPRGAALLQRPPSKPRLLLSEVLGHSPLKADLATDAASAANSQVLAMRLQASWLSRDEPGRAAQVVSPLKKGTTPSSLSRMLDRSLSPVPMPRSCNARWPRPNGAAAQTAADSYPAMSGLRRLDGTFSEK